METGKVESGFAGQQGAQQSQLHVPKRKQSARACLAY